MVDALAPLPDSRPVKTAAALLESVAPRVEWAEDGELRWCLDGNAYLLRWDRWKLTVKLSHLRDTSSGLSGEVELLHDILGRLHWGATTLTSLSAREGIVRKLRQNVGDEGRPPWSTLLDKGWFIVAQDFRTPAPAVMLQPRPPRAVRHVLDPFLLADDANLFQAPPESGKSTLLRAFAVSVATGAPITNTLRPSLTGTVMIYDTESTQDAHEEGLGAMARGFNIDCPTTIYYRHLKGRSLFDVADLLADDARRYRQVLTIIDSFGPATLGGGEMWHERAIAGYNVLSRIPGAKAIIAHQPNDERDRKAGPARPFGGVFVRALARSEWELHRSVHDEGTEHITLVAYHRKANYTRRHPPIGLRFTFTGDAVTVRHHDLGDSPELLERGSLRYRVLQLLRPGAQEVEYLAEITNKPKNTVRATLSALYAQKKVVRLDEVRAGKEGRWALAEQRRSP